MKIMLTGGGTGGHFYPLIAIAEAINEIAREEHIVDIKLYYMATSPYDKNMLFSNRITYVQAPAGKMRVYFSLMNFFDLFKTISGVIVGFLRVFFIFPDVIISKGGYSAFPAVFAARVLGIPVIVHESDSSPGRLNLWTAKFARHIAISFPEAVEYLPKEKTTLTGQPVRKNILQRSKDGSADFFGFQENIPTILILGGSQGATVINQVILDALSLMIDRFQIIHQVGPANFEKMKLSTDFILKNNPNQNNYKMFGYMNDLETKMASSIADIVISRAGSTIFEIASWGLPSIIIPITNSNGDHQRKNAYNYMRSGACEVVEETNLKPHVLVSLVDKILEDKNKLELMKKNATIFAKPDAAKVIAKHAIDIGLSHE